jgi:Mg-chelatase subunit ChlD
MDPVNIAESASRPTTTPPPSPGSYKVKTYTVPRETEKTSAVTLSIQPPASGPRKPSLFICVLDVSGSMGTLATGTQAADASKPDVDFSRLDLVKHSMNTLIAGLQDDDHLAIIPFSNTAQLSLQQTKMTASGRTTATAAVAQLNAYGGTNIWAGLSLALQHAADHRTKNPLILLLTDGEPNIDPPRGLVPTISATIASLGLHVPIHTFGFGYDMNSKLIGQVATATAATYSFIPDCSMVGTVFINFIATALATISHHMTFKDMATGQEFMLGAIQYGQKRLVLLPNGIGTTGAEFSITIGSTQVRGTYAATPAPAPILFRNSWLQGLLDVNAHASDGNLKAAQAALENLKTLSPPADYAADLSSTDDNEGQIGKAIANNQWWQRWGRHYLPSVIWAHKYQVCNNFKDKAVQDFGGEMFREHQARLEQLFLTIQPPAPSIATRSYGSTAAPAVTRTIDMSYYHNLGGGCFAGHCAVKTPTGEKLVRDVKKGDVLVTVHEGGHEDTATVVCVVVSKPPGGKMDIVTIGDLKITPWHPMKAFADGQWVFPAEAYDAMNGSRDLVEPINEVYTFVMDRGHTFVVENYVVCGLGHGLKGPVIGHDYFGTGAIINDLKKLAGWEEGRVMYNELKNLANK